MPESRYLHGTHPDEQDRLSRMNDLLNDSSLRELGLRPGERVLDVGSGLGQLARRMAHAVEPGGRVVGVERSQDQLGRAIALAARGGEPGLVEFRSGDALALPLHDEEWESFDVAHARFLLEHVPDPLAVVRAMARAVRPGGRVVLEDDDHAVLRLWPEPAGVAEVWGAYARAYERAGNDPYVGRRLASLLHEAGVRPVRSAWIFFGGCAGEPAFRGYVENLARILEGAREAILEDPAMSPAAFAAALSALEGWGGRPDATFGYARGWAEGRRPE